MISKVWVFVLLLIGVTLPQLAFTRESHPIVKVIFEEGFFASLRIAFDEVKNEDPSKTLSNPSDQLSRLLNQILRRLEILAKYPGLEWQRKALTAREDNLKNLLLEIINYQAKPSQTGYESNQTLAVLILGAWLILDQKNTQILIERMDNESQLISSHHPSTGNDTKFYLLKNSIYPPSFRYLTLLAKLPYRVKTKLLSFIYRKNTYNNEKYNSLWMLCFRVYLILTPIEDLKEAFNSNEKLKNIFFTYVSLIIKNLRGRYLRLDAQDQNQWNALINSAWSLKEILEFVIGKLELNEPDYIEHFKNLIDIISFLDSEKRALHFDFLNASMNQLLTGGSLKITRSEFDYLGFNLELAQEDARNSETATIKLILEQAQLVSSELFLPRNELGNSLRHSIDNHLSSSTPVQFFERQGVMTALDEIIVGLDSNPRHFVTTTSFKENAAQLRLIIQSYLLDKGFDPNLKIKSRSEPLSTQENELRSKLLKILTFEAGNNPRFLITNKSDELKDVRMSCFFLLSSWSELDAEQKLYFRGSLSTSFKDVVFDTRFNRRPIEHPFNQFALMRLNHLIPLALDTLLEKGDRFAKNLSKENLNKATQIDLMPQTLGWLSLIATLIENQPEIIPTLGAHKNLIADVFKSLLVHVQQLFERGNRQSDSRANAYLDELQRILVMFYQNFPNTEWFDRLCKQLEISKQALISPLVLRLKLVPLLAIPDNLDLFLNQLNLIGALSEAEAMLLVLINKNEHVRIVKQRQEKIFEILKQYQIWILTNTSMNSETGRALISRCGAALRNEKDIQKN